MFTTADLPDDMRYDPDNPTTHAVRDSRLTIECRHGDPRCNRCIREAAATLVAVTTPTVRPR